jgi:hypothetical protein
MAGWVGGGGEQRKQTLRRHVWETRQMFQQNERSIIVFWSRPAHRGETLRSSKPGKFSKNVEGKELCFFKLCCTYAMECL